MIKNFEEITEELNEKEMALIPHIVAGLLRNTSPTKPSKAPYIVSSFNRFFEGKGLAKLTEPRFRKCVNFIRKNGLIPLIATSDGYFVSYDIEIIESQILSLQQRARSINDCAKGLEKFTKPK